MVFRSAFVLDEDETCVTVAVEKTRKEDHSDATPGFQCKGR